MKALWTALFLAGASLPLAADVTKDEVRRLLEAHVSDQTLIAYVQKNGPMQPLTIDDLTQLKNAGASDELLRFLLESSRSSDAMTPAPSTNDYSSDSTTVIYGAPQYYYYPSTYPSYAYAPVYPAYTYSYYYPYRYPYRYYPYRSYPYHNYPYYARPHPYSHYSGGGTYAPHTTVPRTPVGPGGVHPYRATPPPQTSAPPRTTSSPPPATRPAPSRPTQPAPRGHGPYR